MVPAFVLPAGCSTMKGPRTLHTTGVALLALSLLSIGPRQLRGIQTAPAFPSDAWPTSTPGDQGLDPAPLRALRDAVAAGRYGLVDRMVVVRNGFLVVDERWERDYVEASRGRRSPLGCGIDACRGPEEVHDYNYLHPDIHPWYRGRDVHSLQSVTKSVAATLVGIALSRGEIDGLDTPFLRYLSDHDLSDVDPRLRRATVEDLLTMRSGIEWHETDRPLDDTNTTLQLERSDDWIRFTLAQPMDAEPGARWAYSSGGSHLMSGILREATGSFIDAYAEEHLFGPLGIDDYYWKKTPRGYPDTEGGLYLEARDLARIGYLYLRNGMWDGRRILPAGWVDAATAVQVEDVNPQGWGYGYQWWRLDRGDTVIQAGLGFGGQFLLVIPEHDLVCVVNGWNLFGSPRAAILPALLEGLLAAAEGEPGPVR